MRVDPESASSTGYQTATEFFRLPYSSDPMLAGAGIVVRVEVSGAAVQSLGIFQALGIPTTGEPGQARVRAELMLGEDGVARAIRLVP
jgi:hypothetical protein